MTGAEEKALTIRSETGEGFWNSSLRNTDRFYEVAAQNLGTVTYVLRCCFILLVKVRETGCRGQWCEPLAPIFDHLNFGSSGSQSHHQASIVFSSVDGWLLSCVRQRAVHGYGFSSISILGCSATRRGWFHHTSQTMQSQSQHQSAGSSERGRWHAESFVWLGEANKFTCCSSETAGTLKLTDSFSFSSFTAWRSSLVQIRSSQVYLSNQSWTHRRLMTATFKTTQEMKLDASRHGGRMATIGSPMVVAVTMCCRFWGMPSTDDSPIHPDALTSRRTALAFDFVYLFALHCTSGLIWPGPSRLWMHLSLR